MKSGWTWMNAPVVALIAIIPATSVRAQPIDCRRIAGEWKITASVGGIALLSSSWDYDIKPDGTVLVDRWNQWTWTCSGNNYVFRNWLGGNVQLALSADGNHLTGIDTGGSPAVGVRTGPLPTVVQAIRPPVASAPAPRAEEPAPQAETPTLPLAPGAKVLRTSTFTATSNGSGSNLYIPGAGTLTIDFVVEPGKQVQFAVLTAEQYAQALRGQKITGGPVMQAQVTGSGSRSVTLNRGTYFVYFAALNAPQATLTYRAAYQLQ